MAERTGFVLISLLLAVVIVWATHSAWDDLAGLRANVQNVERVEFHMAEKLQSQAFQMDDTIRYLGTDESSLAPVLKRQGTDLIGWIKADVAIPPQTVLLSNAPGAVERHFSDSAAGIKQQYDPPGVGAGLDYPRKPSTGQSAGSFALKDQLKTAEHVALSRFVQNSSRTIVILQRYLAASVVLILALGVTAARLVYVARIVPLNATLAQTRAALQRQEKLASLGTLAAGVAHEIRNPLTAINVRLHGLKRALVQGSSAYEDAEVIHSEARRLERIVQDFLRFARPAAPRFERISLAALFTSVRDLLWPQLDACGIALNIDLSAPIWVQADLQQIEQVLLNLIQNAAESIQHDGTITLRATARSTAPGKPGHPEIVIEVSDTGKGIAPEVEPRLFDPFFSTKEGGLGLGLSIAARIVERHGGTLGYWTQLGQGTTFTIALPADAERKLPGTKGRLVTA